MTSQAPSRRLTLKALSVGTLAPAAMWATPARAADAKPAVSLFLARLELGAGRVTDVVNLTPGPGANFQPAFTRDGRSVLFASDRAGTNNVFRHDLASGKTEAITKTTYNLYSPTPLPDGSGFSAIRVVDADPNYGIESKQPSLWQFGWDGKEIAPVIPVMRVGYHAWIDAQRLALFIVDDVAERNAHQAVLFNRATGKATPLTNKPGRSLGRAPDGRRALFVDQSDPAHWRICAQAEDSAERQVLAETPMGPEGEKDPNRSQYFVVLPDASLLMARGNLLLRCDSKPGASFTPFAELPGVGGAIRNIAVSPDGAHLAFSVLMAARQP